MNELLSRYKDIIFLNPITIIGALMIMAGIIIFFIRYFRQEWKKTTGFITDCGVAVDGGDEDDIRRPFVPYVSYKYRINGTLYENTEYFDAESSEDAADRQIKQYSEEGRLKIYYHPTEPSESIMIKPDMSVVYIVVVTGLMLFWVGLWLPVFV